MEQYTHKVSAIYADEAAARQALQILRDHGFPEKQLRIIGPHDLRPGAKLEPEGIEVSKEIVKDTLIGGGVGGAVGAAGSAAMGAAGVALFVTNPVLATLMIVGYAATIGGIAGAIKGVKIKETAYIAIVEDALKQGHWAIVAHARDNAEEAKARQLIAETVAERQGGT